jgi:hydroxyacylglutathione hydrolase
VEVAVPVTPSSTPATRTGRLPEVTPVVDDGLGNAAYLVDLGDGGALVVDPARDPTPYLTLAKARGLTITTAAETHLHADFLSGSRELARACDARILAPRAAGLQFAHEPVDDGDTVDLGGLRLQALATPGHAPEHTAWLLIDPSVHSDRPVGVFSGGALLVGGVARTDLTGPEQTEPLARAAHHSMQRLLRLPDDVAVYPTHGSGSFCAAPTTTKRTSTIGIERHTNPLAATRDADRFVAALLGGLGSYPPYFLRLRDRNRRGPDLLPADWTTLPQLRPDQVAAMLADGVTLIDTRPLETFATAHPAGAISIVLRPQFATWLGWLLHPEQPFAVVLDKHQDRGELARQAHTIGYDHLLGELAGGLPAWQAARLPTSHIPLVTPTQLAADPTPVLDVRQQAETTTGHLPGATTIELGAVPAAFGADETLPNETLPNGTVTVMCGHGERAMTGASLLTRAGHADVRVLEGGPDEWAKAAGRPLVTA